MPGYQIICYQRCVYINICVYIYLYDRYMRQITPVYIYIHTYIHTCAGPRHLCAPRPSLLRDLPPLRSSLIRAHVLSLRRRGGWTRHRYAPRSHCITSFQIVKLKQDRNGMRPSMSNATLHILAKVQVDEHRDFKINTPRIDANSRVQNWTGAMGS